MKRIEGNIKLTYTCIHKHEENEKLNKNSLCVKGILTPTSGKKR